MSTEHRHIFHAQSVAFAGHIRRKNDYYVPAVASSCLPATGGVGSAEVLKENCTDLISLTQASSKVVGEYEDPDAARKFTHGNHTDNHLATVTHAEASLSGLTITVGKRTFRAEYLEARMKNRSDVEGPTEFHTLSTVFKGLTLDDVELRVSTHCEVLETLNTRRKLLKAYAGDQQFVAEHGHRFSELGPQRKGFRGHKFTPAVPILGTIVTGIEFCDTPPQGVINEGNTLIVENFGSIHFGEILIQENHRRLTLLRFQLGCPDGGECSAVDIGANGTRIPPRRDDDGDGDGN